MSKSRRAVVDCDSGTVSLVEETVVRRISLDAFKRELAVDTWETPILPMGTLLVRKRGPMAVYFVQVPPRVRNVEFIDRGGQHRIFTLACPWVVFGMKFQGHNCIEVYSRAAVAPVLTMQAPLVVLPLPNCRIDGARCMGREFGLTVNVGTSLPETAANVVNYFEGSTYNEDLPENVFNHPIEFGGPYQHTVEVLAAWDHWTKNMGSSWQNHVNKLSWRTAESFGMFAGRMPL